MVIGLVLHTMLLATAYLILLERKTASWVQDRTGPNRTNFSFGLDDLWKKLGVYGLFENRKHLGLGQALADGLKLFVKEDYTPPYVDRLLFLLAPAMAVVPAMIGWAVIPWGGLWNFPGIELLGTTLVEAGRVSVAVAPVQIGVVYILAISSLAVYGVVIGAYASNNKYSFLGGLRATAQMVSYEIPMGVCVLIVILTYHTVDTQLLVNLQTTHAPDGGGVWGVLTHPLIAVIFFICVLAECNRAPFDLAETEQELVGGFHTEYSSMKWALFFLGEYMHMIAGSAFFTILFLGGWSINPFGAWVAFDMPLSGDGTFWGGIFIVMSKVSIFAIKVFLLLFVMMWVRWTLPRLRFDQLMKLAWRGLIPMMLLMLLLSSLVIYLRPEWPKFWLFVCNLVLIAVGIFVGPRLPQGPPVNRRIPLAGSRYSPAVPTPGLSSSPTAPIPSGQPSV